MLLCAPVLTAGNPTQDCLDADICILSHQNNLGPGSAYCQNEVDQTTDDVAYAYGTEVIWTLGTAGLPFGVGSLLQTVVQTAQECTIADPMVSQGPATPRR